MLKIGMLGPDYLRKRNGDIFQQQQIKAITIYNEQQLSHIDGLLITGWNTSGYIRPLQRLLPAHTAAASAALCLRHRSRRCQPWTKWTALRYGLRHYHALSPSAYYRFFGNARLSAKPFYRLLSAPDSV